MSNETAYDVASLFALLARHDVSFLRWVEPSEWVVPPRRGRWRHDGRRPLARTRSLPARRATTWRHKLSLVAGAGGNSLRAAATRSELGRTCCFAVNPDVSFQATTRTLRGSQRLEHLAYQLRARPAEALAGLRASLAAAIKDRTAPVHGAGSAGAAGHAPRGSR